MRIHRFGGAAKIQVDGFCTVVNQFQCIDRHGFRFAAEQLHAHWCPVGRFTVALQFLRVLIKDFIGQLLIGDRDKLCHTAIQSANASQYVAYMVFNNALHWG